MFNFLATYKQAKVLFPAPVATECCAVLKEWPRIFYYKLLQFHSKTRKKREDVPDYY
jgi:hypothetical protein